tara:strand:- start:660 stop:971 length:312 start_codon:yes stop_codon:yes gene_type:complete
MHSDVENDALKVIYLKRYPSLAAFIASDKDKSTAIYRRLDRLSARNLLYLHSELPELQARQDDLMRKISQPVQKSKESPAIGRHFAPRLQSQATLGKSKEWIW